MAHERRHTLPGQIARPHGLPQGAVHGPCGLIPRLGYRLSRRFRAGRPGPPVGIGGYRGRLGPRRRGYLLGLAAGPRHDLLTLGGRTLEQRQDRTNLCLQLAGTLCRTSGPRRSARGACGPEVGQEIPQLRHGETQAPQVLKE